MTTIALTMGDPAGIGGELTLRAWQALRLDGPCFVAIDDPARLAALSTDIPIAKSHRPKSSARSSQTPCPSCRSSWPLPPRPGHPDKANAKR